VVGTRMHYAKRVILTLLIREHDKTIFVTTNLMLSFWCYYLKIECNLLETHAQITGS